MLPVSYTFFQAAITKGESVKHGNSTERVLAARGAMPGAGFTLIELLVAVAVIAVLAALLLPALSRAKEQGYMTTCRSNLRQWGQALEMYADDFHLYPPYSMSDLEGGQAVMWHQRLQRYTATQVLLRRVGSGASGSIGMSIADCPSYYRMGGDSDPAGVGSYGYNLAGYGWGPSFGLGGDGLGTLPPAGGPGPADIRLVRDAEVLVPSDMIAFADAVLEDWGAAPGYPEIWGPMYLRVSANVLALLGIKSTLVDPADPSVVTAVNCMKRRHRGMWDVVFCDAHVESLKPTGLWDPRVDSLVRRWNRDHQVHREFFTGLYSP